VRSKAPSKKVAPTRTIERSLRADGHDVIVGFDEVGRGAWAGPLVVGAAVLPPERRVNGVRDSKMLTETERERLFDRVAGWCAAWAVGAATQAECDDLGMAAAQQLAANRALAGIRAAGVEPDAVVLDGNWDFVKANLRTVRLVKGDATCLTISAASILAKVSRDREMRAVAEHFPWFSFDTNKGYPCPVHKAGLQAWGPSTVHRRTWIFMDHLCWPSRRVVRPEQPTLF
jgi:ribonuclease HII